MARLPDIEGNPLIRREISPDAVLAIDLHRCFDPRDIHEQAEQWRPEIYDVRCGSLLLGLTAINRDCSFRWREGGGIDLHLLHPHLSETMDLTIVPDGERWQASVDGGTPGPIGEAKMALAKLRDPSRPPPASSRLPESRASKVLGLIAAVALFGGGAAWMARDIWQGDFRMPKISDVSEDLANNRAEGWLVMCPAPMGMHSVALDAEGQLAMPRLSDVPLRPVAGEAGRYVGDKLTVTLRGRDIIVWPGNDPLRALTCPAQRRPS